MLVVERLVQHVVGVVVDAVVDRDMGIVLLREDVKLLGEVDTFLLGDLRRGREGGDLARDVDEEVRKLVQPERALAVGVLLEDVPARASEVSDGRDERRTGERTRSCQSASPTPGSGA